ARAYQRAREDAQRLDEALTELKAAQAQRLQSAKLAAIGEVTAIVAHEIRSPLSTIGGFARSIARQPDRLERNARNAQIIVEEVERLERILGDLLDFSKPSEPELSMIQLGPILESVAESIRYDARAEDVKVQLDLAENVPDVLADPKQVRQILQNLVNNALEAMQQAGTLTLGLAERNGAVEMYVQDTGEGIPVERMEQIFDTFYTSKPTGTGLGLALCKKLVAQHGGELLVESEEGRGARFTVSFPHPTETERALRPEDEI
ncbi:MAG: GHKL domain-containing protein, partial [Armatimonadetes bacterium]|nr:GHKL domain-containing protein [Armatimonadota bacterium]